MIVILPHMRTLTLLALAGALGTLARYSLLLLINRMLPSLSESLHFPWGIYTVNVLGCFLFGLVLELSSTFNVFTNITRDIILIGFLGAFTTFSTFIFDCNKLLYADLMLLSLNILGQIISGILALRFAMYLVRSV